MFYFAVKLGIKTIVVDAVFKGATTPRASSSEAKPTEEKKPNPSAKAAGPASPMNLREIPARKPSATKEKSG